jgi:hypothetical protein
MTISRPNRLRDDWCLHVFLHDRGSIENLETQLGVAAASFVENCLFIAALALIGVGI